MKIQEPVISDKGCCYLFGS